MRPCTAHDQLAGGQCGNCLGRHDGASQQAFRLIWGPTEQEIGVVQARTARAAIRKAPLPWRRYLGEIRADLVVSF